MSNKQLKWDITCTNNKVPIQNSHTKVTEIFGGFGRNQRVLTVPQIATLHVDNPNNKDEIRKKTKRINELINNNIVLDSGDKYFEFGIDILDLKVSATKSDLNQLKSAGIYTQAQIGNSKHLYLLSEEGYSLLINLMTDTKSKLIYKNVIRDYFKIREVSLNNKDIQQHYARLMGKRERKKTTDTIKFFIEKGDLEHDPNVYYKNAYALETNFIYRLLFGMPAKEIEKYLELDIKPYDTVRNYLCAEDIDDLRNVEGRIGYMMEDGYSYQEIKARLKELYPEPRLPKRGDKSIDLIKELMLS